MRARERDGNGGVSMRMRTVWSGLVCVIVLASCGGGGSAPSASSSATTTPQPIQTTTSRPVRTTTSRPITTSTTARPASTSSGFYKTVFAGAFAKKSAGLEAQMSALPTVAAVRSLTYDQGNNVVRLDVSSRITPAGTARSVYDNEAWYLMHGVSTVWWNPNAVAVWDQYENVSLLPALHLTLDKLWSYECSPALMVAFAAMKAGQNNFNTQCIK